MAWMMAVPSSSTTTPTSKGASGHVGTDEHRGGEVVGSVGAPVARFSRKVGRSAAAWGDLGHQHRPTMTRKMVWVVAGWAALSGWRYRRSVAPFPKPTRRRPAVLRVARRRRVPHGAIQRVALEYDDVVVALIDVSSMVDGTGS